MTPTLIITVIAITAWLVYLTYRNVFLTNRERQLEAADSSLKFPVRPLNTPDWAKNAVIYQVNTRQFSAEGNFAAVEAALPRIAAMGVDVIWFMPIYPLCDSKKKCHEDATTECLGSHYAVYDFFSINPRYGTPEEFRSVVSKIHELGMKVILDFVPNHTGWDSRWMLRHPEWFKTDAAGAIISPVKLENGESWGWDDVAQLDHSKKRVRENLIQAHEFWLNNFDIDGFREDVAGEVPTALWAEMRPRLEKIRPIFMLSEDEAQGKDHFATCFNANYGWGTHHVMKQIIKGEKTAAAMFEWTESIKERFGKRGYQLNFTQNHDENTWNGTEKELFGDGADCYTALCFVMEGMGLIYNGQESSLNKRLWFFNKDVIDWSGAPRDAFFKTLIDLKHRNKALWNGESGGFIHKISTDADDNIYAFMREKDGNKVVAIFNMKGEKTDFTFKGSTFSGAYKNVFSDKNVDLSGNQTMSFAPFEYLILSNK
jgi:alpha-amylase